jgi:hypothetical protein
MLKLELRGRPLFRLYSQLLLSLRVGVSHPYTRTIVELLGPCFKTGRLYVPLLTTYGKARRRHSIHSGRTSSLTEAKQDEIENR